MKMLAYVIKEFGGPEVFQAMELDTPKPGPGQVLIEVKATSVNPIDCKLRQGRIPDITAAFPAVLHGDVAGIIADVGDGVQNHSIGDAVFACAGGVKGCGGALAEYMLADADQVVGKPASLDFAQAAALPLVSITAWNGLMDKAQIHEGQNVLIYGGSGGVGHVALQLAKARGARVVATVSSAAKGELVKELGADEVVDYRELAVADYVNQYADGRGFDVVFDTVGGDNIQTAFQAARDEGCVVTVSARSEQNLGIMHAKALSLHVVFMLLPLLKNENRGRHGEILEHIAALVEHEQLRPLLDERRFGFNQVAQAHAHLESGQAIGKVVISR